MPNILDNPLAILLSKSGPDLHFSPTSDQISLMPTNVQPNDDGYGERLNEVSMKQSPLDQVYDILEIFCMDFLMFTINTFIFKIKRI